MNKCILKILAILYFHFMVNMSFAAGINLDLLGLENENVKLLTNDSIGKNNINILLDDVVEHEKKQWLTDDSIDNKKQIINDTSVNQLETDNNIDATSRNDAKNINSDTYLNDKVLSKPLEIIDDVQLDKLELVAGATLKDGIRDWTVKNKIKMLWNINRDFYIENYASYTGDIYKIFDLLSLDLQGADITFRYFKGNDVLIVEETNK